MSCSPHGFHKFLNPKFRIFTTFEKLINNLSVNLLLFFLRQHHLILFKKSRKFIYFWFGNLWKYVVKSSYRNRYFCTFSLIFVSIFKKQRLLLRPEKCSKRCSRLVKTKKSFNKWSHYFFCRNSDKNSGWILLPSAFAGDAFRNIQKFQLQFRSEIPNWVCLHHCSALNVTF